MELRNTGTQKVRVAVKVSWPNGERPESTATYLLGPGEAKYIGCSRGETRLSIIQYDIVDESPSP
jgi:hypothetical protein